MSEPKEPNGSVFSFDPKETIPAAITTVLVVAIRVLISVFKLNIHVPEFLKSRVNSEQLANGIAAIVWLAVLCSVLGWSRWRNRRKHVHGKTKPGRIAIYIAELEGDERNGQHRTNVVRSLKRELGDLVQILRAGIELKAEESGNPADDAAAANRRAQRYLRKKGGDLLIWGRVIKGAIGVIELRFSSAAHDSSDEKRFRYDAKQDLTEDFGEEFNAALAAVAASSATPAQKIGQFVGNVLIPSADKIAKILESPLKAFREEDRARLLYSYAIAEETIGSQRGDKSRLNEAAQAYQRLLAIWTRERHPIQWAGTQNNLGNVLQSLGEQDDGVELTRRAIEAFRSALEVRTEELFPVEWANTKNNLGSSLARLGERQNDTGNLHEAAESYVAALKVFSRGRTPLQWAITTSNLANTQLEIGKRERNRSSLEDAINLNGEALGEIKRGRHPLLWASVQNNLGNSLMELGKLTADGARLKAAIIAYRASLKEKTRARSPIEWAMTQFNIANTFLQLGIQGANPIEIQHAHDTYRLSLEVLDRASTPPQWAMVQSNLGKAFEILSRSGKPELLIEAENAYRAALLVLTQENNPRAHLITSQSLEHVLSLRQKVHDERPED